MSAASERLAQYEPVSAFPSPSAIPLPARAGIALRDGSQPIGESWWSRRFIELLESFGLGSRLQRGREYARAGQVLELDVEPGIALARVQGSRYTPYRVRIRPEPFSTHQWRRAEKAIAFRALPLAKLLAGEMPGDIEKLLADAKLALLPGSYEELRASCTCPDAANPCKHTAAVYYVLAERLDEDPFALFTLRGRTREELVESLRRRRAKAAGGAAPAPRTAAAETTDVEEPPPLAELIDCFWSSGHGLDELQLTPLAGEAPDALIRQLGPAPVTADGRDLGDVLAPLYARLAAGAERRALSD
jgi:uncharacterized Zn finger protein